ncbi:tyrosine recombinase XerC [Streptomyces sp. NPDC101234]|uniref:tyrosine recombinase XerC n=1 Tax=Streptomyces sp. NPDC101234 TaxID=3366138 RepID=UPI00380E23BA
MPVTRAGVCGPCLLAARLGEDDPWVWAELHDEALAPGRPRQLTLEIEGITLPEARAVRMPQAKAGRRYNVPSWLRARFPEPVQDDPRICPPQVPGQLGLFPTPARQFSRTHAARITDRSISGFEAVAEQLRLMADERRVRARTVWIWRLEGFARLALAARDPDQQQVAAQALDDLLYSGPVLGQALDRAGLLAPAPSRRLVAPRRTGPTRRFAHKRRRARAQAEVQRRLSEHLLDPAQLELFPAPPRDWTLLDTTRPPALTAAAADLVADFITYMRGRGWNTDSFSGSVRTLRIVTGHLGAEVPIQETDIRALASMRTTLHGPRVVNYLRLRGLLEAQPPSDPCIARARQHASTVSHPAFAAALHAFIDVLLGQGSTSSRPRSPKTVENYVVAVLPTLEAWTADGLTDPRQITKKHIEAALDPLTGDQTRRLDTSRRSLFRALKRERLIFRDPARGVSLTVSRPLPAALPSDRLAGLLDKVDDPRDRLMAALVAVYALLPGQLVRLLRTDLDRSKGRLRLRRPGRMDHLVYLDAFTLRLATAWELQRHRRWPDSSNPHFFVTRNTAVDDSGPPISAGVVRKTFERLGLRAGALRVDRIYDEARHSADPVRLMELFGLPTSPPPATSCPHTRRRRTAPSPRRATTLGTDRAARRRRTVSVSSSHYVEWHLPGYGPILELGVALAWLQVSEQIPTTGRRAIMANVTCFSVRPEPQSIPPDGTVFFMVGPDDRLGGAAITATVQAGSGSGRPVFAEVTQMATRSQSDSPEPTTSHFLDIVVRNNGHVSDDAATIDFYDVFITSITP